MTKPVTELNIRLKAVENCVPDIVKLAATNVQWARKSEALLALATRATDKKHLP